MRIALDRDAVGWQLTVTNKGVPVFIYCHESAQRIHDALTLVADYCHGQHLWG
jgi:hypothetical protein